MQLNPPDRVGPESTPDARPVSYWDGRGLALGDSEHQRVAPGHVAGWVGEYLPPLAEGEVEIVMIGLHSTMGDVVSVRVLRDGSKIRYRIVDEDELGWFGGETRYQFEPHESLQPLTFREVSDLLWSIRVPEWGHLFEQQWVSEGESGDYELEQRKNDFFVLASDFYDGLQEWLDARFELWKGHRIDGTKR